MSRSTQYIGLTKLGNEFVKTFKIEKVYLTEGMFEEEVFGSLYINPKTNERYQEEVQFVPWSGGPMIFTHLKDDNGNALFSWVEDKSVTNEIDYENGRCWV